MERRPTQRDVAEAAGVSRGLVSLALSDSPGVSPQTKARILQVADQLGYVRNLSAAFLAGGLPTALGVVLPGLRNPFFESVIAEVNRHAEDLGLLPLVVTTGNDPLREQTVIRKLLEMRVAGCVVVAPASPDVDLQRLGRSVPMVVLGAEPIGDMVDVVRMDEGEAATTVFRHLQSRGWERVWHLTPRDARKDRGVEGRACALQEAAGDLPFTHVIAANDQALAPVLRRALYGGGRPAIITHNDLLGVDVITALRAMGYSPGQDVGVVSYDDTHLAQRPEIQLSSVRQKCSQLVGLALELLVGRGQTPDLPAREAVSHPELAHRASS